MVQVVNEPRTDRSRGEIGKPLHANRNWRRRKDQRGRQRWAPWAGSLAGHALLLGLVVLIGVNLAQERPQASTPLVTAELGEESSTPMLELALDEQPTAPLELPPLDPDRYLPSDTTGTLPPNSSPGFDGSAVGLSGSRRGTMGAVVFAGLSGGNAKRIAFVVDASGSMIATFPVITRELARSIGNLSPLQSYTVVFFQRDEAVSSPPTDRMVPATPENLRRTMEWIQGAVIPSGRSNPLRALKEAMDLEPEVIYLLSSNVTGSGNYAVDLDALLAQLEALNPPDPDTGQRTVRIQCIQFLDPDPSDALKKIAEIHSGGTDEEAGGFRFLGRSELGLGPGRR